MMNMTAYGFLICSAVAAAATVSGAVTGAMAAEDTQGQVLTVAFPKELETLNAYGTNTREGIVLSRHIWDGLLYRNPQNGEYEGNLATDWEWIDDLTLEFTLREGVKFHNGEPFDADDVVFTFNYIADPANGVIPQRNVSWIKGAQKVSEYKVRLLLKEPFPAALEFLAGPLAVFPDEYTQEVGFEGMGRSPVGTGPYKLTGYDTGVQLILSRNADYHPDSPKGEPSIETIVWRMIPEKNTQYAELLSGGVDWIWHVPADQAERFKDMKDLTVSNEMTMRIGYLGFDASDRYGPTPFDDIRVRKAVAHAINREGMVSALLKGKSVVVNSACFPSQFGCEQDVVSYDYDPDKARNLLAEAGYPDGFETSFAAYRERGYAEAMMADLANVGINASLDYLSYPALRKKLENGEVPFLFMTYASYSINDVSAITGNFFDGGVNDYARDPKVIEWLEIGDTVTDPERRRENYSLALKRIAEQVYWLPLFSYNAYYVYTDKLAFTPTADEIPRFFSASWK
ncbi:ABC transporter substrate-binding protein [Hoeflea sp.]|uniref:ABC transporter substrate-binding protein n=1 Tax=Hoeflea sp. TaxID=1940281 RepID=UPI003B018106